MTTLPGLCLLLIGVAVMLISSGAIQLSPPNETAECALSLTALSPCFPYIKIARNSDPASAPAAVCCELIMRAIMSGRARCVCYLLMDPLLLDFPVNTNRLISLICSCGSSRSVSTSSWIHDTCNEMENLPPLSSIAPASARVINSSIDTNTLIPHKNSAPNSDGDMTSSSAHGRFKPAKVAYGPDDVSIFFWGISLLFISLLPVWYLWKARERKSCA